MKAFDSRVIIRAMATGLIVQLFALVTYNDAHAQQQVTIQEGQSRDLHPVYWVAAAHPA